jgi:thioredoxin 1
MALVANDQSFDQMVLQEKDQPVLVDFWATWCHPCKIQEPIIDELSQEIGDKAKIVKVEVDDSPVVSQKYNVLSIPTLFIFKNGEAVWQGVGVHQKSVIASELAKHAS